MTKVEDNLQTGVLSKRARNQVNLLERIHDAIDELATSFTEEEDEMENFINTTKSDLADFLPSASTNSIFSELSDFVDEFKKLEATRDNTTHLKREAYAAIKQDLINLEPNKDF